MKGTGVRKTVRDLLAGFNPPSGVLTCPMTLGASVNRSAGKNLWNVPLGGKVVSSIRYRETFAPLTFALLLVFVGYVYALWVQEMPTTSPEASGIRRSWWYEQLSEIAPSPLVNMRGQTRCGEAIACESDVVARADFPGRVIGALGRHSFERVVRGLGPLWACSSLSHGRFCAHTCWGAHSDRRECCCHCLFLSLHSYSSCRLPSWRTRPSGLTPQPLLAWWMCTSHWRSGRILSIPVSRCLRESTDVSVAEHGRYGCRLSGLFLGSRAVQRTARIRRGLAALSAGSRED